MACILSLRRCDRRRCQSLSTAETLRGGLRESAQRHLLPNVNYDFEIFLNMTFDISQTSRLYFGDLDHFSNQPGEMRLFAILR
jgi:hypothetical protein